MKKFGFYNSGKLVYECTEDNLPKKHHKLVNKILDLKIGQRIIWHNKEINNIIIESNIDGDWEIERLL